MVEARIPVNKDGGRLDEKLSNSGLALNVGPTGCVDKLDSRSSKKEEVRDDSQVFGLGIWKEGVPTS